VSLGTYVRPSKETLNTFLDGYLKGATRGLRASTVRNYQDAFRPVRQRLGDRPFQSITKADIDDLMDWMVTSGRRPGGKPGTGLSGRSARLTLGRLPGRARSGHVRWWRVSQRQMGQRLSYSSMSCVSSPKGPPII
jgi:hypothetical protein